MTAIFRNLADLHCPNRPQSYNGGIKQPSEQAATAEAMQEIRQSIFESDSGTIDSMSKSHTQGFECLTLALPVDIEQLTTDAGAYGTFHMMFG